ncbi:sensor histidine kinase [Geothrix paludis]|uniref:sensor histidine kinase n=1 Tax=Geothrix paludis TaxID=2922722 RepID=UPI001FACB6BA|nr:ATP-binding protein [Geothrix paludis]
MATFHKTLRFRLTAWYSAALASFMVVFTLLTYGLVHRRLLQHHDGSLKEIAAQALQILSAQADCEHLTPEQQAQLGQVGRLLLIHEDQGQRSAFFLSPEMQVNPMVALLSKATWHSADEPWFETLEDNERPWRVFSVPYQTRMGRKGVIRVVEDLGEVSPILASLRDTLLLFFPLGLAISAVGGYMLAGRALAPVERVTAMAREIEAKNLGLRLPHPGADCEIGRLVDTLNHMMNRLEGSFEAMKRFTADASHELRSPLANIRSLVDVAKRSDPSREECQEDMASIGEEVTRLGQIVDDLLLMARADTDRLPIRMESLRLDELAQYQAEVFISRAEEAGIRLEVQAPSPAIITGDERWIHQLMANLLDNALKFTPRGGRVVLGVFPEAENVLLMVEDTGPGIPETDLRRIFDRFYRCDSARSHATAPGAGLGLAIVHWITQAHQASIRATNRSEGGARFVVRFPPLGKAVAHEPL